MKVFNFCNEKKHLLIMIMASAIIPETKMEKLPENITIKKKATINGCDCNYCNELGRNLCK